MFAVKEDHIIKEISSVEAAIQMTHPGHHTVPSLPILDVALELAGPLPGVLCLGLADGQPALVIVVDSLNRETSQSGPGPLCSPRSRH